MTERDTPVGMFFALQRETIERTGDILEQLVETSAELNDESAIERQREIAEGTVELARESAHRSLDTVALVANEESAEVEEIRDRIDTAFDTLADQQLEAIDTYEQRTEEFTADTVERIGEQVELLVEMNRDIERQLTELAEEFVEQAESGALGEGVGEQVDRLTEQLGTQAERFADLESTFEEIEVTGPDEER